MKRIKSNCPCITSIASGRARAVLLRHAPARIHCDTAHRTPSALTIAYTVRRYIVPGVPARLAPPATWDNAYAVRLYTVSPCAAPVVPVHIARRADRGLPALDYIAAQIERAERAAAQVARNQAARAEADRRARAKSRRTPAPKDPNAGLVLTPSYADPLNTRDALLNAVNRIAASLYRYFAHKDGRNESYALWYSMLSPIPDTEHMPDGISYATEGIIAALTWGGQYGYTSAQVGHILRRAAEHGAHRTDLHRAVRAAIARAVRRDRGVRTQAARAAYARKIEQKVAPCTVTRPDGTTYTIPGYTEAVTEQGHVLGLESYDADKDTRISPDFAEDIAHNAAAKALYSALPPKMRTYVNCTLSGMRYADIMRQMYSGKSDSAARSALARFLKTERARLYESIPDDMRAAMACTNTARAARLAARDSEYTAATDGHAVSARIHAAIAALA